MYDTFCVIGLLMFDCGTTCWPFVFVEDELVPAGTDETPGNVRLFAAPIEIEFELFEVNDVVSLINWSIYFKNNNINITKRKKIWFTNFKMI